MKNIGLILMLAFLLSSCFGIGGESEENQGLTRFEGEVFTLDLPNTWEQVDPSTLPKPKVGEVVLAYVSPEERSNYKNNIVVIAENSSLSQNNIDLVKSLPSYLDETLEVFSRNDSRSINFIDGTSSVVLEFNGKYNNTTPLLRYLQTAKNCGDTAYFLTISVAEELESYERYEYLLSSFSCKG